MKNHDLNLIAKQLAGNTETAEFVSDLWSLLSKGRTTEMDAAFEQLWDARAGFLYQKEDEYFAGQTIAKDIALRNKGAM